MRAPLFNFYCEHGIVKSIELSPRPNATDIVSRKHALSKFITGAFVLC